MPYDFTLATKLPATPQEVDDAWMASDGHTAMTGGIAQVGEEVGTQFSAWDGYIWGETVELVSGQRIRQTWRTADFRSDDADSVIEVTLVKDGDMTLLELSQTNVPDGQTAYEESGWQTYYFEPMRKRIAWLRMKSAM